MSDHNEATLNTEENSPEPTDVEEKKQKKQYDLSNFGHIYQLVKLYKDEKHKSTVEHEISLYLEKLTKTYKVSTYEVIFLVDDFNSISSLHSNRLYKAVSGLSKSKNLLLILLSDGGKGEPAYLISKLCKRLKKEKFAVCIPRKAKSAATLIALGADEIHMGLLSELGPIDPQLNGWPALSSSNALQRLAELTEKYPKCSTMFAKYLIDSLDLRKLGYSERVNESAAQYAERLLEGKNLPTPYTPKTLAEYFTNHYKDHGFVIDSEECIKLLGTDVVKENTQEYEFGNAIFDFLENLNIITEIVLNRHTSYIGSIQDGLYLTPTKNDN